MSEWLGLKKETGARFVGTIRGRKYHLAMRGERTTLCGRESAFGGEYEVRVAELCKICGQRRDLLDKPSVASEGQETIKLSKLQRMMVEPLDKLPQPVAIAGRRKRWVGFGWVDEGPSDGSEPLFVEVDT